MTDRYDAVIAGGGLSGLSLAARLAGEWPGHRLLLVDDPAARPAAASWAYWSATPGPLDAAATRTYRRVRVHAAGFTGVVDLDPYRYRLVRRDELRRLVHHRLAAVPDVTVRAGRVGAVRDRPDGAELTVDGAVVRAGWVFDSVTPAPQPRGPHARLAFTGWEVLSRAPVFDPDTPTLLDFRIRAAGTARFGYVLPVSPHRALVDLTEFVPHGARPPGAADRGAALHRYLTDVLGCDDVEILRTESAVLPLLTTAPRRRAGHVLTIGARGGLIKASTGYAADRIQRDSAAIAGSLARHGHPFAVPRPRRRHRLLDRILLSVLDADPAELERTFARLFAANPAARVLRFLDEDTGPVDELRLIATLRPGPFLRALVPRRRGRRPLPPHPSTCDGGVELGGR